MENFVHSQKTYVAAANFQRAGTPGVTVNEVGKNAATNPQQSAFSN